MSTTVAAPAQSLTSNRFKTAMSRFASGLTAITAITADGRPTGFICQAFSSVSLCPPLILICVARTSTTWPTIRITGQFSVNILSRDQQLLCSALSSPGYRKLSATDWTPSPYGGVRLTGSLTDLDCVIEAVHATGDHDIVVGRVVDLTLNPWDPGDGYVIDHTRLVHAPTSARRRGQRQCKECRRWCLQCSAPPYGRVPPTPTRSTPCSLCYAPASSKGHR
jgi:3-hydroxy-9,10-secoandrosta-1,3,5(10)-triene-9,17-dione monooxygenase reductase component